MQYVRRSSNKSSVTYLDCGEPQESILGLILFVLDTVGLSPHMYADDTQVYGYCRPTAVYITVLPSNITDCVEAATSWMRFNRLQPNPDKTEFLWCATARRQHQLPTSPLLIDICSVALVSSAHDLGVYVDSDLSVWSRVYNVQCRDASPRYVSYARSVALYCRPLFRCGGRTDTFVTFPAGLW